jgi:hypothetical protein
MTEAKLEAALAEKIRALSLAGVAVHGFFETAPAGDVAGMESFEDSATIEVVAQNREMTAWELPQYDFPINIQLVSRVETDKGAAGHVARCGALAGLLAAYCARGGSTNLRTDFSIEGEFTPAMANVSGGANEYDDEAGTRTWSQTFTIRGYTL